MNPHQNLIDTMTELGVTSIRLNSAQNRDDNFGTVELKEGRLKYNTKYARLYFTDESYAYIHAFSQLVSSVKDIEEFRNAQKSPIKVRFKYEDFDHPSNNNIQTFGMMSRGDITDSGVTLLDDKTTIMGNIDQIRKFISLSNNHYRYCRCQNIPEDEKVSYILKTGEIFGLFKPYNDFEEYYHGGIVD